MNEQPVLPEAPQVWQVGQAVKISSYTLRLALGSAGTVNVTIPPNVQHMTLVPGTTVSIPVTIQNRRTAADTFLIVIDENEEDGKKRENEAIFGATKNWARGPGK